MFFNKEYIGPILRAFEFDCPEIKFFKTKRGNLGNIFNLNLEVDVLMISTLKLINGVKIPMEGFGVFPVTNPKECERSCQLCIGDRLSFN